MRTNPRLLAVAAAALLALGACSEDPTEEPDEPTTTQAPDDPSGGPGEELPSGESPTAESPTGEAPSEGTGGTPSDGAAGPDQDPDVAAAINELAADTGSADADIEVVSLEEVTWSDGSIGCPTPGQAYTQALVEGRLLVLTADGEEFRFHGEGDGPLAYCADPIDPAETGDAVQ